MKYKIARMTLIAMMGIFIIYYLFSHYDGKEYNMENVEDYVKKICEIGDVPGMSIVVLDQEKEYYINVGYADKNEKADMTSEIRCELGSTTKAFTALANICGSAPTKAADGIYRMMQGQTVKIGICFAEYIVLCIYTIHFRKRKINQTP